MTLPISIGWERALLGTALFNPDTMNDTGDVLPSDFSGPHQLIWSEMVALHQRGNLGPRALVEALRANNTLDNVGFEDVQGTGDRYIAALVTYRGEEMPEYVTQVIGASTKRELIQTAALIRIEAEDRNIPAAEALDSAERRVMALRRARSSEGVSMADLMVALTGRLNNQTQSPNVWRPTIPELRNLIDFAEAEDYVIFASRPGEGKSQTLRFELGMPAIFNDEPALLINMENSEIEVGRAFLSMVTGINSRSIKSNNLTDGQREEVKQAADILQKIPLYISTMGSPSAAEVERRCRYYISKKGVKKIGVDYVQLMNNGVDNAVRDVSLSSGMLRSIALNFGVPVLAAAQMSRSIEQRGNDAEPQLSDLRESGCLTGETKIQLADGSRAEIRDLVGRQNFEVLSLGEAWKIVPSMARKVWCTGIKPVYKLVTATGREIRATGNHPFRTLEGWVPLDEIRNGELIAVPRELPVEEREATISIAEAALLGHMIGDGCTLPRHSLQYTTDELFGAETVVGLAKEIFGERLSPRISRERNWYQVYLSAGNNLHTHVRNPMSEWLEGYGAWGYRASEKHVPELIFNQPDHIIAAFLHHLLSTDGTVGIYGKKNRRPTISFTSSSKKLAEGVFELLLRMGIVSRITRVSNKKYEWWMVVITSKSELMKFVERVGLMGERSLRLEEIRQYYCEHNGVPNRDVIPSSLWRLSILPICERMDISRREFGEEFHIRGTGRYKYNLSRSMLSRIANFLGNNELKQLAESQVLWDKIVSIEPDGVEEVFDMEVGVTHNFVADNFIVKNSLEQDATMVIFPRQLWKNPQETQLRQYAENIVGNRIFNNAVPVRLHVKKNRNGLTGVTEPFLWCKYNNQYRSLQTVELN